MAQREQHERVKRMDRLADKLFGHKAVVMAIYEFDRGFRRFAQFQLFSSMKGSVKSGSASVA